MLCREPVSPGRQEHECEVSPDRAAPKCRRQATEARPHSYSSSERRTARAPAHECGTVNQHPPAVDDDPASACFRERLGETPGPAAWRRAARAQSGGRKVAELGGGRTVCRGTSLVTVPAASACPGGRGHHHQADRQRPAAGYAGVRPRRARRTVRRSHRGSNLAIFCDGEDALIGLAKTASKVPLDVRVAPLAPHHRAP